MSINLTIDNKKITAEAGRTVLQAALANGIYIPNLCYHPSLPPLATCRLCIVKIEGLRGFPTSCSTEAKEGMVVTTDNDELSTIRRRLIWLTLSELPKDQPKDTQLMKVVEYCGVDTILANYAPKEKDLPVLADEPLFERDMSKCVLCGRCVAICQDVRGVGTLGFVNRGYQSVVGTAFGETFSESECKFCGACVAVCPSGAMMEKTPIDPADPEKVLVPCRYTCPAHIDIPRYLQLAEQGKYQESLEVIRETVPFPHSLGLVCDHPCEEVCRRQDLGGSLAIRDIKRFVAEQDDKSWRAKLNVPADTGKKVAIIGGGPAGLSAAWFLRLKGHQVTVFEALKNCGGMMFSGIPRYRLPLDVLNSEVKEIENIGVKIVRENKVEELDPLFDEGYDAVFLGLGAPIGSSMKIPGDDDPRVTDGIYVLKGVSHGNDMELTGNIGVVGGGNVAMDVARTALRVGADEVNILYRRAREQAPADPEEIEESYNEGVKFNFLVNPIKVTPKPDYLEVTCIRMELGEPDSSGRRRPVPVEGSEFTMNLDKLVVAIGQNHVVPEGFGVDVDKWGSIPVDDDTRMTSRKGVFAGGDVVTGPASVIKAIQAGRLGAMGIDAYLGGDGTIGRVFVEERTDAPCIGHEPGFAEKKRAKRGTLPVSERLKGFPQVDFCFKEGTALAESSRCLRCQLRLKIAEAPMPPEKTK